MNDFVEINNFVEINHNFVEIDHNMNNGFFLITKQNIEFGSSIIWMEEPKYYYNSVLLPEKDFEGFEYESILTIKIINNKDINNWMYLNKAFAYSKIYQDEKVIKDWIKNKNISFHKFKQLRKIVGMNCFYYKDLLGFFEKQGIALYKLSSFLNYSCNPNCFVFFYDNKISVISTRKILTGEKITIPPSNMVDYMHIGERRNYILKNYYYMCMCEKCIIESDYLKTNHSFKKTKIKPCSKKLTESLNELLEITDRFKYLDSIYIILMAFEDDDLLSDPPYMRSILLKTFNITLNLRYINIYLLEKCIYLLKKACKLIPHCFYYWFLFIRIWDIIIYYFKYNNISEEYLENYEETTKNSNWKWFVLNNNKHNLILYELIKKLESL